MYLIAIAWLYVVIIVAVADTTVVGGILTFVFWGLGPLALFLWLFSTPARRRQRAQQAALDEAAKVEAEAANKENAGPSAPMPSNTPNLEVDQAASASANHTKDANRPVTPSRR